MCSVYLFKDLTNEVKFGEYAETKQFVSDVGISQLIQLYLNHRYACCVHGDSSS